MKPYWLDKDYGVIQKKAPPPPKQETRDDISDLTNPAAWLMSLMGGLASSTGIQVTPLKMMGIATTFACVRCISTAVASLPLILWKSNGKGGREHGTDHRLYSLLYDSPNEEMSIIDFLSAVQANVTLQQNGYAEIMRDSDGDVVGLYPVPADQMKPEREPVSLKLRYRFNGTNALFKSKDIVHLRGYTTNGVYGMDMTRNLQDVFGLAIALQNNAASFFGNGSRPGGILEHPAVLSAEAQQRLLADFKEKTGGQAAYNLMVLEEGMKYSATRTDNTDSQFQEAREYQDLQICRVFRVPPHKVGIKDSSPKANVEESNAEFVTDVLRFECVNWEKKLNMQLLTLEEREQGYAVEFDMEALMRANTKERYEAYALGRNGGWLNANTILKKEKMNPIGPIGDIYLQPVNYVPLGTLPAAQAAPSAPGDKGGDPTKGTGKEPAAPAKPAAPAAPQAQIQDSGDPADRVIEPITAKPKTVDQNTDVLV